MAKDKIGIALSGGGIRALLFHLGMFKWMAENKMMSKIKYLSTVSGGSICIALIYSCNNNIWPDDETYLHKVLPLIIKRLQRKNKVVNNIVLNYISDVVRLNRYGTTKKTKLSNVSKTIKELWGVDAKLNDLSGHPEWYINCTNIEFGVNFRFHSYIDKNDGRNKVEMGDKCIGFADASKFDLAKAVSMSAAFPYLVGSYTLNTSAFEWKNAQYKYDKIHIWDGGVYDNLGLEVLFDIAGDYEKGNCFKYKDIDYLVVSNASPFNKPLNENEFSGRNPFNIRLLNIIMNQNISLRTRNFISFCRTTQKGMYVNIGNSVEYLAASYSKRSPDKVLNINKLFPKGYLSNEECEIIKCWETTLNIPKKSDMLKFIRHGYENAKMVYECHNDN